MRLFIGIRLSDAWKAELSADGRLLRSLTQKGNFTEECNFHITLAFLGEVAQEQLPLVTEVLQSLSDLPAFTTHTLGIGTFPKGTKAVVYRGVTKTDALEKLHDSLCASLSANGLPYSREESYTPHITHARNVPATALPADIDTLLPENREKSIDVCDVSLFLSGRVDGLLRYTPIFTQKLR